ncbi:DUF1983 domain-containing protein [Pseudohoeflea suaedae]|uniref:DUF1983 domain-containing protein n=1 Tax=Pseudohoeflea suaedae TaxID=877384 RepID=A0A4R5PJA5_9HYPH|nr:phage tail protein [Pseudohoeflea suaedae]TDH35730.1 DUF1983 domain-containing protein [Pseudohoeflea suaedae]
MPFISAIVGFVGTVVGAVGSFIGGLGFLGKALLSIGLNLAVQALTGRPEQKQISGVELDTQYGGRQDRIVRMGRWGIAGHYTYANTYGNTNKYLQQVFTISDYPCTSLDKVWIDGEPATLSSTDSNGYRTVTNGDYGDLIKIKFVDGTQTAADSTLIDGANPDSRWTEDHKGVGICYVICRLSYNREKLGQTVQFFFEGKGAKLYDWRKDDTVGGSGDHRWADPDTWEFTENPILMDYAYRRGLSVNDDEFCGMFEESSRLPLDRYSVAANICDELFNAAPRYRCAAGINCNAQHGDNIDALMRSCGGMAVHGVDGAWPIVGTDQATVATLTDDDLIVGEPVQVQFKRPANELVNSVSGTFPDPDNIWSPSGYKRATDAGLVAVDRRSKDVDMNFDTVPYLQQASQLASVYFSENRFEATAQIMVRQRWQVLEPGDWIVWSSTRYGSRTFMVTDMSVVSLDEDKPRTVALTLQERSGDIYEEVGVIVPTVPVPPGQAVYQQQLVDFTATGVIGAGANGLVYPMIRVSWSAPSDPTVAEIIVFWRVKAGPGPTFSKVIKVGTNIALLTEGIVSETEYEVWHQIVADPARETSQTTPIDVETPRAPSRDVEVTLGELQTDVYGSIVDIRALLDDVRATLTDVAASSSQGQLSNQSSIQDTLAAVAGAVALVRQETNVRASADLALAEQITSVSASLGDLLAQGLFSIQAQAGAGEVLARIILYARASVEDDFEEAGMEFQVKSVEGVLYSQIVVNADKFVVTDGSTENLPLVFESGELKLQVARMGAAILDSILETSTGKTKIGNFGSGAEGIRIST